MKSWPWPVALLMLILPLLGLRPSLLASAQTKPAPLNTSHRFTGAASCAAAACHNANFARGTNGSEFTHWMANDRHAKAYEVLFEKKALAIVARLGGRARPHEDRRCLTCHVHPDYGAIEKDIAYFKTDGVSCESCHGPAGNWLAEHYLPSWRQLSIAEKQARGMKDTQSPLGRAQACVRCHVGAANMEVDHDLIAAGHPRLHFEFAAFHDAMPRHWPDIKDRRGRPDFEAHLWAAGQLVSAQAALDLLVHRTEVRHASWPEFAEFDCAACHHALTGAPVERGKRKTGVLPWGSYLAMTPDLLEDDALRESLANLQQRFDSGEWQPEPIAARARKASSLLTAALRDLDLNRLSAEKSLARYLARGPGTQDEWTQLRLGLAALPGPLRLKLPADVRQRGARVYDPQSIRRRLHEKRQ